MAPLSFLNDEPEPAGVGKETGTASMKGDGGISSGAPVGPATYMRPALTPCYN